MPTLLDLKVTQEVYYVRLRPRTFSQKLLGIIRSQLCGIET